MLSIKTTNVYFNIQNFIFVCIVLFIAIIILLLPSINYSSYVNSTITSKALFFIWGLIITIPLFIGYFIFKKTSSFKLRISKIDIGICLLFIFITINRYTIQPEHGFSIRYIELLGLSTCYVILRNLPLKNYVWFLLAIVISGIIQAVYGNLQLLDYYPSNHSGFKLTGSFFNPGPYAGFLATVWPIALGMYLFKEKLIEQIHAQITNNSKLTNNILRYVFEYIPLLGVVSIILVIPATHSRGAWLAVIVSSLLLLEFRYHFIKSTFKKLPQTKRIVLIILATSLFIIGLFGVYHFKKGSADGRLFIWKVSSKIIKDFPITGVGFDRFKAHYMNYQANYFAKHGETKEALVADNSYYAFNDWLQFFAEQGFIGVVLLLSLVYIVLKTKTTSEYVIFKYIAIGTLIAASAFASFSYPMQILPFKLIIVVTLSLLATIDVKKIALKTSKNDSFLVLSKSVAVIITAMFLIKAVYFTQKTEMAYKDWKIALNTYQYGDYEGTIDYYKKAYPMLKKEGDFLMNYGKSLTMYKQPKEAIQILEEAKQYLNTTIIETALGDAYKGAKQYHNAEITYKHAYNMIPTRFYPLYLQVKLYEDIGENEKVIAIAQSILKKDIKVPSTAIREIKAEMKTIIKKYNQFE
jgi:tetratricopeptide (TPR) repeat protein